MITLPCTRMGAPVRSLSCRTQLQGAPLTSRNLPSTSSRGNALVVLAGRGKGKGKQMMRRRPGAQMPQMPPSPPVDPDNEEFVIFVRAKKFPRWYPYSVVKGGSAANNLVKSIKGDLTKEGMFRDALVRNIGQAVYKGKEEVIESVKAGVPQFKGFTEFEFGFNIRDKSKPDKWYMPDGVVTIPPEDELGETPLDSVKDAVSTAGSTLQKGFEKGLESITSNMPSIPGMKKEA